MKLYIFSESTDKPTKIHSNSSITHMSYTISGCWSEQNAWGAAVVSRVTPWLHSDVTSRWRHLAVRRQRTGDADDCTAWRLRSLARHVDDATRWRHEIADAEATTVVHGRKTKTKVEKSRSEGRWDDVGCRRGSTWPARYTSTLSAERRSETLQTMVWTI